jgi:hypothetical protein
LTSALVEDIERVDDRPRFKLPPIIVFLVNLEAHDICTFLDKYNVVGLLKFLGNLELCWDSPDFQNVENGSNAIRVIFVFKCVERVFKATYLDLHRGLDFGFQIGVVSFDLIELHVTSLSESHITRLFVQLKELLELLEELFVDEFGVDFFS